MNGHSSEARLKQAELGLTQTAALGRKPLHNLVRDSPTSLETTSLIIPTKQHPSQDRRCVAQTTPVHTRLGRKDPRASLRMYWHDSLRLVFDSTPVGDEPKGISLRTKYVLKNRSISRNKYDSLG